MDHLYFYKFNYLVTIIINFKIINLKYHYYMRLVIVSFKIINLKYHDFICLFFINLNYFFIHYINKLINFQKEILRYPIFYQFFIIN